MAVFNLQAAKSFLLAQQNQNDLLFRESTKTTGNNYYVSSANGLTYKALKNDYRTESDQSLIELLIKKALFGKCTTTIFSMYADIFDKKWVEATKTSYAFKNTIEENWGTLIDGSLLNNNATGSARSQTENKLNVKCAYIIHEWKLYQQGQGSSHLTNAQNVLDQVLATFDDNAGGYVDSISSYREAYKQALVKICTRLQGLNGSFEEATGMWDGTLQDATNGGVYMRYIRDGNGDIVNNGSTYENTESTAFMVIAYDPNIIIQV